MTKTVNELVGEKLRRRSALVELCRSAVQPIKDDIRALDIEIKQLLAQPGEQTVMDDDLFSGATSDKPTSKVRGDD